MEFLIKKENLFIRIAIGFILGIILGLFSPEFSVKIKFFKEKNKKTT